MQTQTRNTARLELKRLEAMHRKLDQQLARFATHRWLSSDEHLQVKELKKKKLLTKDRIARLQPWVPPTLTWALPGRADRHWS